MHYQEKTKKGQSYKKKVQQDFPEKRREKVQKGLLCPFEVNVKQALW
jgi:hypothetical protein